MGYQAITQIVLVITSLVIIYTFLEPKFQSIRAVQDETAAYDRAVMNAEKFNRKLDALQQQIQSLRQSDVERLERFLPTNLDSIKISRDLQVIAEASGLVVQQISYEEATEQEQSENVIPVGSVSDGAAVPDPLLNQTSDPALNPFDQATQGGSAEPVFILRQQQFSLTAAGTYDQIKQLIANLERNAYPLEIQTLNLGGADEETSSSITVSQEAETMMIEIELAAFALPANQ